MSSSGSEPKADHARLTLRIYKVNAEGTKTEDRGELRVLVGRKTAPLPPTSAFPPCGCPRCRTR
jgi:hypothetical protein